MIKINGQNQGVQNSNSEISVFDGISNIRSSSLQSTSILRGNPQGFDVFMDLIIKAEGSERRNENQNKTDVNGKPLPSLYSQYGVMETSVNAYIKEPAIIEQFVAKIRNGTFSVDDAKVFYAAMLNDPKSNYAKIYAKNPLLALNYADAITNQGMTAANSFYEKSKNKGNAYDAFIGYRIGGYLGQSYVDTNQQKNAQGRNNYIESWINRMDRVEEAFTGKPVTNSFRELQLDCSTPAQLNAIAEFWNVDPQFLSAINPYYQSAKTIRVPTYAYKMHGEEVMRRTQAMINAEIRKGKPEGQLESAGVHMVAAKYNLPEEAAQTFARTDNWTVKLRVQLPITGISTKSLVLQRFLQEHPDAFQAAGADYVFAVANFEKKPAIVDRAYTPAPQQYSTELSEPRTSDDPRYNPNNAGSVAPTAVQTYKPDFRDAQRRLHHYVIKGETLYGLCGTYNVSLDDLRKWNKLEEDKIFVKQNLIVSE